MYITDLDFNQPAAWIGWAAAAVAFLVFGYLFYRNRKNKSIKIPAKYWRVPVLEFTTVFVAKTYFVKNADGEDIETPLTEEMAQDTAEELRIARDEIWRICEETYGVKPEHGWPMGTIAVKNGNMSRDHPHVEWTAPHGDVALLIQDTMYYWFVREVHNIFRYRLHGMEYIYKTKDAADKAAAVAVEVWIANNYGT